MRSDRLSYTATPAGTARALNKKPRQKKPKKEINQLMLLFFFIVLPVLGLLAFFLQPFRYIFIIAAVVCMILMWLLQAFKLPGRLILTAVYGLLCVISLVSALNAQHRTVSEMQTTTFLSPTPEVTSTPAFAPIIGTMGTDVPADFYVSEDSLEELNELDSIGLSGVVDDVPQTQTEDEKPAGYTAQVKSGAEIALENFMEKWRKAIIADMVEFTAPSWRNAQSDPPQQQLFWKFAQRPLLEWRQMAAPTGTDASNARTITVEADVNYGGETRTYQYDAITLNENEKWYVDPDSLSNGILVVQSTATPDPNLTPSPTPEPTPTPGPGPKTKLYYNKDGGKKYHADQNCPSVAKRYLPLKGTFNYGDINKSPYNKLTPCDQCDAPPRP